MIHLEHIKFMKAESLAWNTLLKMISDILVFNTHMRFDRKFPQRTMGLLCLQIIDVIRDLLTDDFDTLSDAKEMTDDLYIDRFVEYMRAPMIVGDSSELRLSLFRILARTNGDNSIPYIIVELASRRMPDYTSIILFDDNFVRPEYLGYFMFPGQSTAILDKYLPIPNDISVGNDDAFLSWARDSLMEYITISLEKTEARFDTLDSHKEIVTFDNLIIDIQKLSVHRSIIYLSSLDGHRIYFHRKMLNNQYCLVYISVLFESRRCYQLIGWIILQAPQIENIHLLIRIPEYNPFKTYPSCKKNRHSEPLILTVKHG